MKGSTKVIIGGFLVFAIYNELQKRNNKPKIYYNNTITGNYNARTIPPFGIFIKPKQKDNKMLLNHELVHWKQYQEMGLIKFYANYSSYNNELGYDLNPMEIEARILTGEKQECIYGYTECVRNGTALTVQNENFRL